jgi:hypothetical protein
LPENWVQQQRLFDNHNSNFHSANMLTPMLTRTLTEVVDLFIANARDRMPCDYRVAEVAMEQLGRMPIDAKVDAVLYSVQKIAGYAGKLPDACIHLIARIHRTVHAQPDLFDRIPSGFVALLDAVNRCD